jgi:hypothetical protein
MPAAIQTLVICNRSKIDVTILHMSNGLMIAYDSSVAASRTLAMSVVPLNEN